MSTSSDCKDIGLRKVEFEASVQNLFVINECF